MLLWHLAERWGRVGNDGVIIPVRLTHSVLASLVAARRPTVSAALGDLEQHGLVRRIEQGLLLVGEPPGELLELRSVAVPDADQSISGGGTRSRVPWTGPLTSA
jgi:hypothetical protein